MDEVRSHRLGPQLQAGVGRFSGLVPIGGYCACTSRDDGLIERFAPSGQAPLSQSAKSQREMVARGTGRQRIAVSAIHLLPAT